MKGDSGRGGDVGEVRDGRFRRVAARGGDQKRYGEQPRTRVSRTKRHNQFGDATDDEGVGLSRDRKGAVEATCRVYPSLTVGARFSAIFMGELKL